MNRQKYIFQAIGIIHSPHKDPSRTPIQPVFSICIQGKVELYILKIEEVDILDGTPLLDIKPYIKRFDLREDVRSGWQDDIPDDIAFSRGRRYK